MIPPLWKVRIGAVVKGQPPQAAHRWYVSQRTQPRCVERTWPLTIKMHNLRVSKLFYGQDFGRIIAVAQLVRHTEQRIMKMNACYRKSIIFYEVSIASSMYRSVGLSCILIFNLLSSISVINKSEKSQFKLAYPYSYCFMSGLAKIDIAICFSFVTTSTLYLMLISLCLYSPLVGNIMFFVLRYILVVQYRYKQPICPGGCCLQRIVAYTESVSDARDSCQCTINS